MNNAFFHIAVHETVHDIAANNPEGFNKLKDVVNKYIDSDLYDREKNEMEARNHAELADEEEMIANITSSILSDPDTFTQFADRFITDEESRGIFLDFIDSVAEFIRNAIDKIKNKLGWQQIKVLENNLTALEEIRDAYFEGLEGVKKFRGENTTALNLKDKDTYSKTKQIDIQNYLDSINYEIVQRASELRADKSLKNKRIEITNTNSKHNEDLNVLLGFDTSGYRFTIDNSAFKHIEKRHGKHGKADSTMEHDEDLGRIGYVLENYDSVEPTTDDDGNETYSYGYIDKNGTPAQKLKYTKQIDGTYYVVTAVPESKYKRVWVISAYLSNKKNSSVTHMSDAKSPDSTPNNAYVSPSLSNFNIDDSDSNVKKNSVDLDALDQQYEEAVKAGRLGDAQEMVDDAAERAGLHLVHMYHGSLNNSFTVFDKTKANTEGNSGAGFYFTTNPDDAEQNYSEASGADNFFKISALAEMLEEEGEWNGIEIRDSEHAKQIAEDILNKEPGVKEVYLKYDNPYVRDFRNSTNIYDKLYENVDDSLVDRDDYDNDDDYEEELMISREDQIYEQIYDAVYGAYSDLENTYEYVDGPTAEDIARAISEDAFNYERLTWDDIATVIDKTGEITIAKSDSSKAEWGTNELTRAIIENFGYDAIQDKEVSQKFGQLNRNSLEAEHIIVFKPNQIKLSDPVTYDDNGNVIPLSARFNINNDDVRYSANQEALDNGILPIEDIHSMLKERFDEYETDEENLRIAAEAINDLQHTRENNNARRGSTQVRTIAKGITSELVQKGYIEFRGKKVDTPEDLAKLCQVLRDPRFETSRVVLTKGNKIVSFVSVTAKLPGSSPIWEASDLKGSVEIVKDRMRRTAADGYYLVHNHPSGDVTASIDDLIVTTQFIMNVGQKEFKGHIILDHDKFGLIEDIPTLRSGRFLPSDREVVIKGQKTLDLIHTPEISHPLLGENIGYDADLAKIKIAEIGRYVNTSNDISVLIYTSVQGDVRGIQEVSNKTLQNDKTFKGFIKNQSVEFGTKNVFLYTTDSDVFKNTSKLINSGYLTDIVYSHDANSAPYGAVSDAGINKNSDIYWMGLTEKEVLGSRMRVYETASGLNSYGSKPYNYADGTEPTVSDINRYRFSANPDSIDLSSLNNSDDKNLDNFKNTVGTQYKLNIAKKLTPEVADKMAGRILREYHSSYAREELSQKLTALINDAARQGKDLDVDTFINQGAALLSDVLEKSTEFNQEAYDADDKIRSYLNGIKIKLTSTQEQEVTSAFESVRAYRAGLFGSAVKINQSTGTSLNVIWGELSALNPVLFPADANEGDMPMYLADAAQMLKKANYYFNPYGFDAEGMGAII
ncbi:MAG: hypothetical protein IKI62_01580, partial [Clostridia bacterium]|nr:hypothetical protein [Clostridia bacterium]